MKFNKFFSLPALAVGVFVLGAAVGAMTVSQFSDVEGHWAADNIQWAADAGLVKGDEGKDTFRPDDDVTRGELVTVMYRYHQMMMKEMDMMHMDMAEEMDTMKMEMEEMEMMMNEMKDGMDDGMTMEDGMTLHLQNMSETHPLSPGVVVVHTEDASLNLGGTMAPDEFERLAEVGEVTDELRTLLEGMEGVVAVYDAPALAPGETADVMMSEMSTEEMPLMVSVMQMVVTSNDTVALVDGMMLMSEEMQMAVYHDLGFEDNSDLGSGFEGGQPDPERTAEENLVNGISSEPRDNVMVDERVAETVLEAMVK